MSERVREGKPKPTFKLERKGTFPFNSYCWVDGPKEISYEIEIVTGELDGNGFVFDNREIEKYFENHFKGEAPLSCEEMAEEALYHFCDLLPSCLSITVKITGDPQLTWLCASVDKRGEGEKVFSASQSQ